MTPGSNTSRFRSLGLLAVLCLTPALAHAQADTNLRAAEPPPAPPPPAPPPPVVAPAPVPDAGASPPAPNTAAAPVVPPDAATPEPPADGEPKKKKNKNKSGDEPAAGRDDAAPLSSEHGGLVFSSTGGTLQLKGRVFARAELAHRSETVVNTGGGLSTRDVNSLDLSLASARFGIEYQSPLRWLSAELELDIAGNNPTLKDAYIQAGKRFFVKAGHFKVLTAALELESPWTLPLVRRGLVNELLTDWLDVAGRRPGVAVGFRCKCALKPRLTLGAFQGTTLEEVVPGDRDVELLDQAGLDAQSYSARGELKVAGVQLGAWYEHRIGSKLAGEFEHFPTFGIDATLDETFERGGVRVWLDGGGGKSLYVNADKPDATEDPLFLVGRALVGYRFGGVALGDPYLEPFGFFAVLDPDTEVVSDFATEAALGVNAGYWDRARLTLQAEMTNGQRNFPEGFLANVDPDRLSVLLQAGARF
jgi:hypothetical protein